LLEFPPCSQINTTMSKEFKIAVFPGDNCGPEVTNEAIKVECPVEDKRT